MTFKTPLDSPLTPFYAPMEHDMADHYNNSMDLRSRSRSHSRPPSAAALPLPPKEKMVRLLPSSRRFWADFTLGFADGLTVPFALTAGLSSLGRTDTVLYAGLAEISAGCISMGIGGYLSAKQTASSDTDSVRPQTTVGNEEGAEPLEMSMSSSSPSSLSSSSSSLSTLSPTSSTLSTSSSLNEKRNRRRHSPADALDRYLQPLELPHELRQLVLDHAAQRPHIQSTLDTALAEQHRAIDGTLLDRRLYDHDKEEASDDDSNVWPVSCGLSVAVGYLIGGMLPLWPYFFVQNVGDGLCWSFGICVVALFLFGFTREYCLSATDNGHHGHPGHEHEQLLPWKKESRIPWTRVRKSAGEGMQMVILGGIAAVAAVLCVRWFEGSNTSADA